ncbi:hypothetical protein SLA2020_475620 [Shorea laevis]
MLQRLGIVMAISGLTPEALAVLESMTAQRQLGFCPILFTYAQQLAETAAFSSYAASKQGTSFIASSSGRVFPHCPAASTLSRPQMLVATTSPRRKMNFSGAAISVSVTYNARNMNTLLILECCIERVFFFSAIKGESTHYPLTVNGIGTRRGEFYNWSEVYHIPCLGRENKTTSCCVFPDVIILMRLHNLKNLQYGATTGLISRI